MNIIALGSSNECGLGSAYTLERIECLPTNNKSAMGLRCCFDPTQSSKISASAFLQDFVASNASKKLKGSSSSENARSVSVLFFSKCCYKLSGTLRGLSSQLMAQIWDPPKYNLVLRQCFGIIHMQTTMTATRPESAKKAERKLQESVIRQQTV